MRPIDADKLVECINTVQEWALAIDGDIEAIEPVNKGFISLINSMPTVKAEPVRHGHWIDEGLYADNFPHHAWRCSKCGWHELEIEEPYGNYCRNCGAKMDERKQE